MKNLPMLPCVGLGLILQAVKTARVADFCVSCRWFCSSRFRNSTVEARAFCFQCEEATLKCVTVVDAYFRTILILACCFIGYGK